MVEGAAREAADRGYNVMIVEDCCASASQEARDLSLTTTLPFLTTTSSPEEVMAAMK